MKLTICIVFAHQKKETFFLLLWTEDDSANINFCFSSSEQLRATVLSLTQGHVFRSIGSSSHKIN